MSETWGRARRELDGLPGGRGLNIAYEAVDRHVARGDGDRVALRLVAVDEQVSEVTYRRARRADQPVRPRARHPGRRPGRGGVLPARPRVGDLRDRAGHAQAPQRLLPAVRGVRARAGARAAPAGRRAGAGHHPGAVPPQDRSPSATTCPAWSTCCSWTRPVCPAPSPTRTCWPTRRTTTRSGPPRRRPWRCCTSPAARRARPRARCTCTRPSSPTTPRAVRRSTCARATSSGAPPTRAGSPARPTASSRRSPTASRWSATPGSSTPAAGTASSSGSGSPSGTPRPPPCAC